MTLVTSKQTYRVGREEGAGRGTAETPWLWDHLRFGLSRIHGTPRGGEWTTLTSPSAQHDSRVEMTGWEG